MALVLTLVYHRYALYLRDISVNISHVTFLDSSFCEILIRHVVNSTEDGQTADIKMMKECA